MSRMWEHPKSLPQFSNEEAFNYKRQDNLVLVTVDVKCFKTIFLVSSCAFGTNIPLYLI